MLEKASHFISGSVQFEILGDGARFLNVASKSGFGLWGFSRKEKNFCAWCKAREYRKLAKLHRRSGVRLSIRQKKGLAFLTPRIWGRKGMLVGMAAGIALCFYLSGFVWNVRVVGEERLSENLVLDAARKSGVYVGAAQKDFSPRVAGREIQSAVDGIGWLSVNTDGCFVEISMKESKEIPEIIDDSAPSNLVAERAAKVLAIEAHHGRPEVDLGETVEKGQVLIAGVYVPEVDPYGPQPEVLPITVGAARGSVIGETYREFTVQVSSSREQTVKTGEMRLPSFTIFGLKIPLSFRSLPLGDYARYQINSPFTALGEELPVGFVTDVYELQGLKTTRLSRDGQKAAALLKLREAQRAQLPKGSSVLKEELSFTFSEGLCVLQAKCRCREEIGRIQETLVE